MLLRITLPLILMIAGSTAPVYAEDATSLTQRMNQVERQVLQLRQTIVEQEFKISQQQTELQNLRGENEVLQHKLTQLQQQQQKSYLDLDQRLKKLPTLNTPSAPVNTGKILTIGDDTQVGLTDNTPVLPSTTQPTMSESELYQHTFAQLQKKQYQAAIAGFQQLIAYYATGDYADNAQYWLGESFLALKNYNDALAAFNTLTTTYPSSPKYAHALLKIGYVYYEMKDYNAARVWLSKVTQQFPNSATAHLASQRLAQLPPH